MAMHGWLTVTDYVFSAVDMLLQVEVMGYKFQRSLKLSCFYPSNGCAGGYSSDDCPRPPDRL